MEARTRGLKGSRNGSRPPPRGIFIGTWRFSPPTLRSPYAVWASIDLYKRVFRHIVSEDKARNPLPGLKSNCVKHCDIDYEPPFCGLSNREVKEKVFEVLGEELPVLAMRVLEPGPRRQTAIMPRQRICRYIDQVLFVPNAIAPDIQGFFHTWAMLKTWLGPDVLHLKETHPEAWLGMLPPEARHSQEILLFIGLIKGMSGLRHLGGEIIGSERCGFNSSLDYDPCLQDLRDAVSFGNIQAGSSVSGSI